MRREKTEERLLWSIKNLFYWICNTKNQLRIYARYTPRNRTCLNRGRVFLLGCLINTKPSQLFLFDQSEKKLTTVIVVVLLLPLTIMQCYSIVSGSVAFISLFWLFVIKVEASSNSSSGDEARAGSLRQASVVSQRYKPIINVSHIYISPNYYINYADMAWRNSRLGL